MARIKLFQRFLLLALAPLLLIGCSRISNRHFVDDSIPLERRTQFHIFQDSLYYTPPEAHMLVDKELVVRVLNPEETIKGRSKVGKDRDLAAFAVDFEKALANQLWRTDVFHDVGTLADKPPIADPDIYLDIAITQWHEGSAPLRWIIRAAGKTRVQVEGKFTDANTGKVYAAFADARVHPGHGLISRATFMPQALIAEDLANFVKELQRRVLAMTGSPEPERGLRPRVARMRPPREAASAPEQKVQEPATKVRLSDIVR
jgi:hypothetical protein